MKGTVLYGPRDVRFEDRETPRIAEPTDALIRIALTCVCGSDLWPYRGLQPINGPTPMGHEYCGIVEEVGSAVRSVKPGQFVIGSPPLPTTPAPPPLPQLPVRLPVVVRAPRVYHPGAGAGAARAAGGRDAGADAGRSAGRPDPESADDLGRPGHRLVCSRRRQREARIDRRGRRRRRRRPARRT